MKKIFYILSAGLLFAAVSCSQKEIPYEPGELDIDGCYGVFFPSQEAAATHYFEPAAEKIVDVTVKRTNASGAIDVPFVLVGENTTVYKTGAIHFDNGEEETILTVELDNSAEQAKDYPVTIEIQDPQYASKYSSNNAFISFSTMIVTWENLGTFTFYDNWWGESHVAEVIYYDIDGVRTCKTQNERDAKPIGDGSAGTDGGFWGTGADYHLEFKWYTKLQNADGYDYVELPLTYFGFDNSSYGPVYVCDYLNYYHLNGRLTSYDFASYVSAGNPNGFTLPYYDPRGELYFYFATPIGTSGYWYGAGSIQGLREGYVPTDYSLAIAPDVTQNGVVPITVEAGADVAAIYYIVYEGALGKATIGDHVAAIMRGSELPTKVALESATSTLEISLKESGEYTILAIPGNAKGELQEADYAYASFNFLAEGDEMPVVAKMGVETLSGKYEAQGYNSDNALEIWAYGIDITVAKLALFKYIDIAAMEMDEVNADVKANGVVLDTEDLVNVNGEGFSLIASGLMPGTSYVAVAYFSNGYEETWLWDSASTTGDPLPIYQDFSVNDYDPDFAPTDKSDILGSWNYYGVDWYGTLGVREYLGKVTIAGSDTPDLEYDGGIEQYVNVSGLSAGGIEDAYSYELTETDDDTVEFAFDTADQALYVSTYWAAGYESYDESPFYFQQYASAAGAWYRATYYMAAIPVMDGYMAFVDVSGRGYEFNGWRFIAGGYIWTAFTQPLLVDPAKDDNGLANSAALSASIEKAKHAYKESVRENNNFVLTEEGRKHAIAESFAKKQAIKSVNFNATTVPFTGKVVDAKVSVIETQCESAKTAQPKRIAL